MSTESYSPHAPDQEGTLPELPDFDPHDFAPGQPIDNPYFPLREGFTYHYVGREFDEATGAFALAPNDVRVPHEHKQVDGVQALVVYDTDDPGSQPSEATRDYYAQDKLGNVWSMGELTTQVVRDRQGKVVKVTHEGSWEAGVNGAKPGLVMKAHPRVGDDYFREHAPGVALDSAAVTTAGTTLSDHGRTYHNVLVTKETSALDPGVVEFKWYAPGVGLVLSREYDQGRLVSTSHFEGVQPNGSADAGGHGAARLTLVLPSDLWAAAPGTLTVANATAHTGMPAAFPVDGHLLPLDLASLF
jgi:hypothetical protein